jgi:signal transduction histidine kinase
MDYESLSREELIAQLRSQDEEIRALKRLLALAVAEPTTPLTEMRAYAEAMSEIAPSVGQNSETLSKVEETVDHMVAFLDELGLRLSELDQQLSDQEKS